MNNNINNITESFRQVFISPKNSGYLFDIIISKTIKNNEYLQPILFNHINEYRDNLIQLQKMIFDDFFIAIYNKSAASNNIDLEDILIELNKLAVSKFEMILLNDLNNKHKNSSTTRQQSTRQPTNQPISQPINQQSTRQPINQPISQPTKKQSTSQQSTSQQSTSQREEFDDSDYFIHYKEFCSKNSVYENAKYTFQFSLNNIKSAKIENMRIKCNMYNINDMNNKFVLTEQNNKNIVVIPIGYYDLDTLLNTITNCMNNMSINKNKDYIYKVFNSRIKNRIVFECNPINQEKYNRNVTFGISFPEKFSKLRNMLGFHNNDYINNNVYVAELHHNISIYEQIYIKLYIDNKELRKYSTSSRDDFYFFETFYLDLDTSFGRSITLKPNDISAFIFDEDLRSKTLSIEFYSDYNHIITQPIFFKCLMSFEYI
jgi:hypothetical protein